MNVAVIHTSWGQGVEGAHKEAHENDLTRFPESLNSSLHCIESYIKLREVKSPF